MLGVQTARWRIIHGGHNVFSCQELDRGSISLGEGSTIVRVLTVGDRERPGLGRVPARRAVQGLRSGREPARMRMTFAGSFATNRLDGSSILDDLAVSRPLVNVESRCSPKITGA